MSPPSSTSDEWAPEDEEHRGSHYARSLFEMATGLGLGTGIYWILRDQNLADWDDPRLERRFDPRTWVLDNNSLFVNFMGHPLTGGLSYAFARGNHHGVAPSLAYSFLTSFLWEMGLEFKEKISINDMLVTPGAGLPVGEFVHKLGMYLDTGDGASTAVELARWSLGTAVALDRHLDGRAPPRVVLRDDLGFARAIWHDFSLKYGAVVVDAPRLPRYVRYQASLTGRLVTLRGYLQPVRFGRAFYRAEVSDLSVAVELSPHGPGAFATADTIVAGYHAQNMYQLGRRTYGVAVTVGSSLGWAYLKTAADRYREVEGAFAQPRPRTTSHAPTRTQQYAGFHLPGLALDLASLSSTVGLSLSTRVAPSFGALGAPAFYDWAAANPDDVSKSVVHRQGYFYGWGVASAIAGRVWLGPMRAGFELRHSRYSSQQGWDRTPERLTVDVPIEGDLLRYSATVGLSPSNSGVTFEAEAGVRRSRSGVAGYERTARALERGVAVRWSF